MPPGRAFAGYAAGKVAGSMWKRYNPWRKGGYFGIKKRSSNGGWKKGMRGKFRKSGYYGRYNRGPTQEFKFHDVTLNDITIQSTGLITASVNLIAQGTGESERIGRKCTIRGIDWRATINLASTTNPLLATDMVRVIMYVDKQCNGAAAASTDLLETADYLSHYNLANRSRFRFLYDRVIPLNVTAAAGNGTANDSFDRRVYFRFMKRCSIPLEFNSTTGAITEIRSNNIGVFLISDRAISGFTSEIRLRFTG